jgi:peptidoglycan/xylan/chitin deacetylase (PgdA/CDA1 family)
MLIVLIIFLIIIAVLTVLFCVFFDQAIFNRRGTIYRVKSAGKKIALTFDDGPSPKWTPLILDELKKCGIKATFFMVGYHARLYPDVARRVAREGHTIGNHGYAHSVMFYYTPAEIEEEIKYTEHVIREITGVNTKLFRPPKAWLRHSLKETIKSLGYKVVLWSLNSKDWVRFDHKQIVKFIAERVHNGDILLFHDSGNVFSKEGGDRTQTVRAIPLLVKTLKEKGYEFVSAEELINE